MRELVDQATSVLGPLSRKRALTVTVGGDAGQLIPLVDGGLALQAITCLLGFAIDRTRGLSARHRARARHVGRGPIHA